MFAYLGQEPEEPEKPEEWPEKGGNESGGKSLACGLRFVPKGQERTPEVAYWLSSPPAGGIASEGRLLGLGEQLSSIWFIVLSP